MRIFSAIFLSVLLFCGCAGRRAASRSAAGDDLYGSHLVGGDIPFVTETGRASDGKISFPEQRRAAPYAITFPASEMQHVSITSHDPFGDKNVMEFDVRAMTGEFCYPLHGRFLSGYGPRGSSMHTGIDIKGAPGDTIRCIFPGVVRMSKAYSTYGNIVVVRHYNGLESVYAHNSKNLVEPNDVVEAGTPLSLAGRTGRATTEHLHFEFRVMGQHFDPELLLDPGRGSLSGGTLTVTRRGGKIVASNPASSSYTAPVNTPRGTAAIAGQAEETYTVVRGDTLYSISRRYGISVNELCRLNGISAKATLGIGKRLKIR